MEEKDMKQIVKEAVKETLVSLGIDACDPMETQQDFHFLRDLRLTTGKIKSKARLAVVGVLVAAALGVLWIGIKKAICG
jgi:hypothetical protein